MADIARTAVTRTVTLSDLTPAELASILAAYDAKQQAAFFSALTVEARDWPGTGWDGQAWHIVSILDADGTKAVGSLAEHFIYHRSRGAA